MQALGEHALTAGPGFGPRGVALEPGKRIVKAKLRTQARVLA
jgi:hypothetical protein